MQNGPQLLGTLPPLFPQMLRLLNVLYSHNVPHAWGYWQHQKALWMVLHGVFWNRLHIWPAAQRTLRPELDYTWGPDFWSLTHIAQMYLLATEPFWCFIILEVSIFHPGTKPCCCWTIYLLDNLLVHVFSLEQPPKNQRQS